MKFNVKELSNDELISNYTNLKAKLFFDRLSHKAGQIANPMQLREARKDIARILTEMKVRNIDASSIKMVKSSPKKSAKKPAAKKEETKKTKTAEVKVETKKAAAKKGE